MVKRSTIWCVEDATDATDTKEVATFDTEAEAEAEAQRLKRLHKRRTYLVSSYEWVREE